MKPMDYVLTGAYILITLVMGFVLLRPPSQDLNSFYLEVQVDNQLYQKVELPSASKQIIEVDNEFGHNLIVIEGMDVYIKEADCHDKLCIIQGRISKVGEVIACLPNKLIVEIKGEKLEDDIDIISH